MSWCLRTHKDSLVVRDLQTREAVAWSLCYRYRYLLTRRVSDRDRTALWILLNPSIARLYDSDPTITRVLRRSQLLGFGTVLIANAFALRSTYPEVLYEVDDPVGPDTNDWLVAAASHADTVIAGWGSHAVYRDREAALAELFVDTPIWCVAKTKKGHPKHPLYEPYHDLLERWN